MTWTPSVVTERRVGCKIRFGDTAGGLEWGKGGEEGGADQSGSSTGGESLKVN